METTLGGGRLGSGNKQEISTRNYERSTHDLSYLWRSSMAAGTLVPFMCKLGLPGDNWNIDLNAEVMTLPTIGPLFGSYKVQLDVFEVPLRLYNAKLHMNKLGVGMDMSKIYLPQIELLANNHASYVQTYDDNEQVNPSSLLKYLGISGLGHIAGTTNPAKRYFNAVPLLAYWDIYKNYYANKQEEIGYFIHTNGTIITSGMTPTSCQVWDKLNQYQADALENEWELTEGDYLRIYYPNAATEPNVHQIACTLESVSTVLSEVCENFTWSQQYHCLTCYVKSTVDGSIFVLAETPSPMTETATNFFGLQEFDLANIDEMREDILQYAGADAFKITSASEAPYGSAMDSQGANATLKYSVQFSQEGLGLKTYQSDLFNNWINTEWIDGTNGIAELTAVSTVGDSFTIDALNIAQKVYAMLNRIALSGGTYDDWLDAVYTHERVKGVESPVYHGSLIKELAFEEVISNTETAESPLGTLAGRGRLTEKNKGGRVNITINEPAIILGIVSLTPRIEYSQGNDFIVNLKTYDDFHKPALDGIAFQDLVTEQLLWTDSSLDSATSVVTYKSLGKQPAWINYMTSVNKVYGSFADENNSMFMTLNRRYEKGAGGALKDGTTYIDPTKYNQIFAEVALDSQNFWTQISCNITARRKMSAKIIPNL